MISTTIYPLAGKNTEGYRDGETYPPHSQQEQARPEADMQGYLAGEQKT